MAPCRARRRAALLPTLTALFGVALLYSIISLLQYENVFNLGYDYDQLPEAPVFLPSFYRQFFDFLETPLAVCQQVARFTRSDSWEEPVLCLSEPLNMWSVSDCLMYAFHHTDDADADYAAFERGAAEQLACEVHVFDLTGGRRPDWVSRGDEPAAGSVTWHVMSGSGEGWQPADLADVIGQLGHEERIIHHLRLAMDLDTRLGDGGRLPPFLQELQRLRGGELELLGRQVAQLQLALVLRPAGLSAGALSSYQRAWWMLSELHRLGFSVLESRAPGRVVWLPGLGRQVATSYNLLLARHMPLQSRRSAQLGPGGNSSYRLLPHQVNLARQTA